MWAELVPESSVPGLPTAAFSLCPHMAERQPVPGAFLRTPVLSDQGPTPTNFLHLDSFLRSPGWVEGEAWGGPQQWSWGEGAQIGPVGGAGLRQQQQRDQTWGWGFYAFHSPELTLLP